MELIIILEQIIPAITTVNKLILKVKQLKHKITTTFLHKETVNLVNR